MALDSAKDLRFALWEVELLRNRELVDDIADRTVELEVNFYEHGQANDFDLTLEDRDGRFSDPDAFRLGDEIRFWVWFADRPRTLMGVYQIDELRHSAPPSLMRVSGLAHESVGEDLRTLKTRGFEGMSLHAIVRQIAAEHGLTPVIKGADVPMQRTDQKEEHDLQFLTRLASDYGHVVRIEGDELIFIRREIADAAEPLLLDGLLRRRAFRHKTFKTYRRCKVRYFDPEKKEEIEVVEEDPQIENTEELVITQRAESREQATEIARSRLRGANRLAIEAEFECLGVPELKAGMNILVQGEGKAYDGIYHVPHARHRYSKSSGYTVELGVERRRTT